MSEPFKNDHSLTPQQIESRVLALVEKMSQQLIYLEKKIDNLISQSQAKPLRENHYSKPAHSYGHHFAKHKEYKGRESREFSGPKKFYGSDRDNNPSQERHFKKKFDGKSGGFDPRKKAFFHKKKD